jgi:hypothetical protein
MKANHISQQERLKNRIANLKSKLADETEPIGYPNPYYRCIGCKRSSVEISMYGSHFPNCPIVGIKNEIRHYEDILKDIL